VWAAFVLVVLCATFALAVIMRRQWVQNERYPLPLAQVPLALLGEESDDAHALPSIWRNKMMWAGFAVTLFWCIVRIGRAYNTAVPNMSIAVQLKPYLSDAAWGRTWDNVSFTVYALFLGLGLFVELNVLMSLVVGYLLFRLQFWFGETYGFAPIQNYPFSSQQLLASYLTYACLVVVFTRKYLWRVLKAAVKGEKGESGEAMSYRGAFLLLIGCAVAVAAWSSWVGLSVRGILTLFAYLLLVSFVAMKLRAECGMAHGRFNAAPSNAAGIVAIVPVFGMPYFGPEGVIFLCLISILLGYYLCFYNLPGLQLELMEVGRRMRMKLSHIGYTAVLGVVAGVLIGGWVYLSSLYAIGADNYPLKAAHFEKAAGSFKEYNTGLTKATEALARGAEDEEEGAGEGLEPKSVAMIFAAVLTAVVTLLRQLFAGFWFHPVGVILGPTSMMGGLWGSLLMAWLIRFTVLKLGGAATVREKLLPFATGIVLGTLAAYVVAMAANGYVYFFNPGGKTFGLEFL
jgi:hypothetical protein